MSRTTTIVATAAPAVLGQLGELGVNAVQSAETGQEVRRPGHSPASPTYPAQQLKTLALYERPVTGQRAPNDQGVDLVRPLVGVDRFGIRKKARH